MELALNTAAGANALLTRHGNALRIRLGGRLRARLIALPLLAAGGSALYIAGLSVAHATTTGVAMAREVLPGQLITLAIGLVCGIPGLMALLMRSYVDIDPDLGRVSDVRQFGPLRITRTMPLASLRQIRTTADHRDDVTDYYVELIGAHPTGSIQVGFSRKRAECQVFARDLRRALKLPFVGLSYIDPHAD
jgi:hypothetical protein